MSAIKREFEKQYLNEVRDVSDIHTPAIGCGDPNDFVYKKATTYRQKQKASVSVRHTG